MMRMNFGANMKGIIGRAGIKKLVLQKGSEMKIVDEGNSDGGVHSLGTKGKHKGKNRERERRSNAMMKRKIE